MNSEEKNRLKEEYRNKEVVGGVYCIRCSGNQRTWIKSTQDLESMRNRFEFALVTKTALEPSMCNEWTKYGAALFSFEVLEEIKKGKDQSDKEFLDDVAALYELWLERKG